MEQKKSKKKSVIIIIALLVVLAAAIAVLAVLNAPKDMIPAGELSVKSQEKELAHYTLEDISKMDYIEVEKEIISSNYDNEKGLYRGVPLYKILDAIDPQLLLDGATVVTRASDGYVSALSVDEVNGSDDVLIIYMRDGEYLKGKDEGGNGPLRLLMAGDEYGNRSTKYLYEIEVR